MLSSTGHDSNAGHELTAERMISGTPADVFDATGRPGSGTRRQWRPIGSQASRPPC
jgi:hypothetical protein